MVSGAPPAPSSRNFHSLKSPVHFACALCVGKQSAGTTEPRCGPALLPVFVSNLRHGAHLSSSHLHAHYFAEAPKALKHLH